MHLDQVRRLIVDGLLIPFEEVDQEVANWIAAGNSATDGDGFVSTLVGQQRLTDFQAQAILAGIQGPYKLGPYHVFGKVAAGRLGTLFRAVHEEFQQPVSLKIYPLSISADRERAARRTRELRVAVQVEHPNVIRTYQVGRAGNVIYAALEDLEGETLAARLERESHTPTPALPTGEACRLMSEAAAGLGYLHQKDIILRDIQPANLWITSTGHLKIMEFGASRDALAFLDDDVTHTDNLNDLLGNYDYVSPEQDADTHSADFRSDLYSMGCVLFHCLTGRVVFPDKSPVRKLIRHARDLPPSVQEFDSLIPDEVAALVAKLLAKNPEDRVANAGVIAAALEPFRDLKGFDEEIDRLVNTKMHPSFLEWVGTLNQFQEVDELHEVAGDPAVVEFLQAMTEQ